MIKRKLSNSVRLLLNGGYKFARCSFTTFLKEEFADHHCQIGNLGLVLDTMEEWISSAIVKQNSKEDS